MIGELLESCRLRGTICAGRMKGKPLAVLGMIAVACAAPPKPAPVVQPATPEPPAISAAALVDHEGDSTETAVTVPRDAPGEGLKFENDWIYDRIGRFRRLSQGTGVLAGRRYDVIEVETPRGDKHKFYFDITENWDNWKPPQS